ncbi:DUF4136 domain-containing protein [Orrella daihaiensis]|uniref:DUF4136 domain-containing protein n=1 Tax=Orrella daihaiensis TaxID=2782176 RepID=A0ABY4AT27_9BURK|nr:DUF4136 domain-containing protein [Orrella daihaiensis]UOD51199.1 DUF4136 domain-containing protein [Orrella daihaiensis]
MRSWIRRLWVLPLVLLVAACASGPQINTDYDQKADFASFRTFAFMDPLGTDRAGYTTLLTERLKTLTRLQMEQRGYSFDPQSPDLLINFLAQSRQQTEYVPPPPMPWGPNYYGYRMGWYDPWVGYGFGPDIIQYTQGVLSIDLIDARKKQLVWEGVATSVIDNLEQATSEQALAPVVADIFARYPFLAGSGVVNKTPQ